MNTRDDEYANGRRTHRVRENERSGNYGESGGTDILDTRGVVLPEAVVHGHGVLLRQVDVHTLALVDQAVVLLSLLVPSTSVGSTTRMCRLCVCVFFCPQQAVE